MSGEAAQSVESVRLRGTPMDLLREAVDTQHTCVLTWQEARQVLAHIEWLTPDTGVAVEWGVRYGDGSTDLCTSQGAAEALAASGAFMGDAVICRPVMAWRSPDEHRMPPARTEAGGA